MLELPLPNLACANLKTYIADGGGCDDFLFNGPKVTEHIEVVTRFGRNGYRFKLAPTTDGTFIIIDEPELGLHPYAIVILAELIQATSRKTQIIVSTQSPALVDCFEPEEIIVVNRKMGASAFERLNKRELSSWLEDYSLGDLWRKNIVAGVPAHE